MSVVIACPKCNAKLTIPDKVVGRAIVCPLCATRLKLQEKDDVYRVVPDDSPPPSARRSAAPDNDRRKSSMVKVVIHNAPPPAKRETSWIAKHVLQLVFGIVAAVATAAVLTYLGLSHEATGERAGTHDAPRNDQPTPTFAGKWRVLAPDGKPAAWFTLTAAPDGSLTATKSNSPNATGKCEVVGDEVRITWSDGFRDCIRPTKGAGMTDVVFNPGNDPGRNWDGKADHTNRIVKEP